MRKYYRLKSYRKIIRALVEDKATKAKDMSFSKLAAETKIQRSFLSQVVNLKNHLHNDQLFAICEALELPPEERDYLMTLSEFERSKNPERKAYLRQRLDRMEGKASKEQAQGIFGVQPDALDDYFCDPHAELVLHYLEIERFRREPERVRNELGLSPTRWKAVWDTLLACGFLHLDKAGNINLPKGIPLPIPASPADRVRNINARMRVAQQKLKQKNIDDFLYNSWYFTSREGKKQLKISHLHLMQRILEEARTVRQDKVYQLTLDILSV